MKLLLSNTSFAPSYGGPAVSVVHLGAALAARGHRVILWAPDGSAATSPLVQGAHGLETRTGTVRDVVSATGLPDIIHDNGIWLSHHHEVARTARRLGIPRVVTLHGMLEPWALNHRWWKKRAAWHLYQKCDLKTAAVLHATAETEAASARMLDLDRPIVVVPNGVELPNITSMPEHVAAQTRRRRALFLSRVHPKKGLAMLLKAWATLRPDGWELVIAGPAEGGHDVALSQQITDLRVQEEVTVRGPVYGRSKSRLLRSADVFVLPTHSENFGIVIGEALAHERPVLTTTAAPWELLAAERCGWWVAPTLEGITDGLAAVLGASDVERRAMGRRGRRAVSDRFTWENVAGAIEERLYRPLLARRAA